MAPWGGRRAARERGAQATTQVHLEAPRLVLEPYSHKYLQEVCRELSPEIIQYQFPDAFESEKAARRQMDAFQAKMEAGEMLELVILDKTEGGAFAGGLEAHGLNEPVPELGIWLKKSAQGRRYGRETLAYPMDYESILRHRYGRSVCRYEADRRNTGSLRFARKFRWEKVGEQEVTAPTGNRLFLEQYDLSLLCTGETGRLLFAENPL